MAFTSTSEIAKLMSDVPGALLRPAGNKRLEKENHGPAQVDAPNRVHQGRSSYSSVGHALRRSVEQLLHISSPTQSVVEREDITLVVTSDGLAERSVERGERHGEQNVETSSQTRNRKALFREDLPCDELIAEDDCSYCSSSDSLDSEEDNSVDGDEEHFSASSSLLKLWAQIRKTPAASSPKLARDEHAGSTLISALAACPMDISTERFAEILEVFPSDRLIKLAALRRTTIPLNGKHRWQTAQLLPAGTVVTLAGGTSEGFVDGPAKNARFRQLRAIVRARDGALYVSDAGNHRIRRIVDGVVPMVMTISGGGASGFGEGAFADGGSEGARFNRPSGITLDRDGGLLIADSANNRIRSVSPEGAACTFACTAFYWPWGIAMDPETDHVFVSDLGESSVHRISACGMTNLAGL